MSTNHTLRTAPGTMIANVPGILGFYPREAAVIMTVCAEDGDEIVVQFFPWRLPHRTLCRLFAIHSALIRSRSCPEWINDRKM